MKFSLFAYAILWTSTSRAAVYQIPCAPGYIATMNSVASEFDQVVASLPANDSTAALKHAEILKKTATREAWELLNGACAGNQCSVSDIRDILLKNITAKVAASDNVEFSRYKIAAKRFFKALGFSAVFNAVVGAVLKAGLSPLGPVGEEIRSNIMYILNTAVFTALGGNILSTFVSNKTEAAAYKAMEREARGEEVNSAIGNVDPVMQAELTRLEAAVNPIEARLLSGSRRATETLSAYSLAFSDGIKQAVRTNTWMSKVGYINAATAIWAIIKSRFESTPETKLVPETMATNLWASFPDNATMPQIDGYRITLKNTMIAVHKEVYGTNLSDHDFESGEGGAFLNKLFNPTQLQSAIQMQRELERAYPVEKVIAETLIDPQAQFYIRNILDIRPSKN